MKKIYKTFEYRLYPTKKQEILLAKHFGCNRFVYNFFLNQRKEYYQENKKNLNYVDQAKIVTQMKKQEDYSWLKEVNAQSIQATLRNLDTAYRNFFSKKAKFPTFKRKKDKNSFCIPQNIRIIDKLLYIPKFKEGIKIILHRELEGTIQHATIKKTKTNKYFVCILCEIKNYEPKNKTNKEIGIDLGIKDFIITSKGQKFKNYKFTYKYQKQLKKAQQHLSRKQKGSKQFEKQKLKVALIHEKITNCRKDNQHKISRKLVNENQVIYLESLTIKNMVKNHKLAKAIEDCAWFQFTSFLDYKANWDDKIIYKIDRFYPSSKTCSNCGWIKQDLNLKIRNWTCPKCGTMHDRDINAAINILLEGRKEFYEDNSSSAGTVEYTNGENVRPFNFLKKKKANLIEVGN